MSTDQTTDLARFGLSELEVRRTLGKVKVRDVDYADLYFESSVSESVSMEEDIVKRAGKSVSQGVGVRATAGEKTGFPYSDELTRRDLEIAPRELIGIRKAGFLSGRGSYTDALRDALARALDDVFFHRDRFGDRGLKIEVGIVHIADFHFPEGPPNLQLAQAESGEVRCLVR